MAERLSDLGYLAISKETGIKGIPVATPNIYVPIYTDGLMIQQNNVIDDPIVGQKFAAYQVLPGNRSYGGTVEIMGEPNTMGFFFDMMMNKTGTTGAGPYTHAFAFNATAPNSYTVDIAKGNVVFRYMGVEASDMKPAWNTNELRLQLKVHALSSFGERGIASIATTSITLDTNFLPKPNVGLMIGDLVSITSATNATARLDTTVATVAGDGITVTLAASAAAFVVGDKINLRPATPSLNLLRPFLYTATNFNFAPTASAALTAAPTPLEEGSDWHLVHKMLKDQGEHRSGSQEPVALVRTLANSDITLKKFFDLPIDLDVFQNIGGQAMVIRHYSGPTNQYELRLTFYDIRIMSGVDPTLKTGDILYSNMKVQPIYNATAGMAVFVQVINNVATV